MTILVPTDFSTKAKYALDLACQIAQQERVNIGLLHLLEHPEGVLLNASGDINLEEPMENPFILDLLRTANNSMGRLVESCPEVHITKDVHIGRPNSDLADNIVDVSADLIIMSHEGKGEPENLGKIPEKVIRTATCPVLTIKSPTTLHKLKSIVYATNLSEKESPVIEKLKILQQWLRANILIVKVFTTSSLPPDETRWKEFHQFIKQNELKNCLPHFTHAPSEEKGILEFAQKEGADIVAVGTHGRKGLARLFSGSIAEDLSHHAQLPVWTCNLSIESGF